MRERIIKIYIPQNFLRQMMKEAEDNFPNETGGSLMGYLLQKEEVIIVTSIISCGPKAVHKRYSFVPDYEFQETQIAQLYEQSGRLHTYLGDWHSHPGGGTVPSSMDQRTMKNIATHADARAPQPIMVILGGEPGSWKISFWQLQSKKILGFLLQNSFAQLAEYDDHTPLI